MYVLYMSIVHAILTSFGADVLWRISHTLSKPITETFFVLPNQPCPKDQDLSVQFN